MGTAQIKMKEVAAYMLCVLGGNSSPSAADVKGVLASVGATPDDTCLDKVISELNGKDLEALIAEGGTKMASVAVAAAPAAGGAAPAAGAPAAGGGDAKKEAAPPAEEEEEDMGFSLSSINQS